VRTGCREVHKIKDGNQQDKKGHGRHRIDVADIAFVPVVSIENDIFRAEVNILYRDIPIFKVIK